MRTNCVFWAYALRRRRRAKGKRGDVYWRGTRWRPSWWPSWLPPTFPHALYGETINGRLRLVSYKPTHPKPRLCPPPVFTGTSRWGDL